MSNLVEKFIEDVRMAEQLSDSKRPLAIRQKITEYEEIIVQNGAVARKSGQYLDKQKDRAFQAITDHSTTPTADFYQEVFNELSLRSPNCCAGRAGIIEKLNREINAALADPNFRARLVGHVLANAELIGTYQKG